MQNDAKNWVFDVYADERYIGQVMERYNNWFSCWIAGAPFKTWRMRGIHDMMEFWRGVARGE